MLATFQTIDTCFRKKVSSASFSCTHRILPERCVNFATTLSTCKRSGNAGTCEHNVVDWVTENELSTCCNVNAITSCRYHAMQFAFTWGKWGCPLASATAKRKVGIHEMHTTGGGTSVWLVRAPVSVCIRNTFQAPRKNQHSLHNVHGLQQEKSVKLLHPQHASYIPPVSSSAELLKGSVKTYGTQVPWSQTSCQASHGWCRDKVFQLHTIVTGNCLLPCNSKSFLKSRDDLFNICSRNQKQSILNFLDLPFQESQTATRSTELWMAHRKFRFHLCQKHVSPVVLVSTDSRAHHLRGSPTLQNHSLQCMVVQHRRWSPSENWETC